MAKMKVPGGHMVGILPELSKPGKDKPKKPSKPEKNEKETLEPGASGQDQ